MAIINDRLEARVDVWPQRGENIFNKGVWTPDEDAILSDYVRRHGEGSWNSIHRNSTLRRTGKSCRLRWVNHLRPSLKKGPMSPEEEAQIIELQSKFGNKWAIIANHIEGRTDNDIKNYWNTRVKKCWRKGLPIYPPPQIQQPSFSNVESSNFISPSSPHRFVIPPVNLVENDNNDYIFDFLDPFQTQQFLTSQSQTQSLFTESPSNENVFGHHQGEGILVEDAPMEESHTFNLNSKLEASWSNDESNSHLVNSSLDLLPQIGMTSNDQEMAALENIDLTTLLEFPVPPPFADWYTTPADASTGDNSTDLQMWR